MLKIKSTVVQTTFEQIPMKLVKKIAQQEAALATAGHASCAVCGNSVNLESCKTDEHGKAVHQHCYMADILSLPVKKLASPDAR
jgi:hypothetical protein